MKKLFYSTMKMNEFSLNTSHSGVCAIKKYKLCWKEKKCLYRFCGLDEESYFGRLNWDSSNQAYEKYRKKELSWRRKEFKQCKPVKFSIERIRTNPENIN